MNTLNKNITAAFFKDADSYYRMIALWRDLVNHAETREHLTAADHLLYLVLRGKDWRRAFSPITNPTKVANGATLGDGQAFVRVLRQIKFSGYQGPFSDLLSESITRLLAQWLPDLPYENPSLPATAYKAAVTTETVADKGQPS